MRRRPHRLPPPRDAPFAFLHALRAQLPVALFLACALSALGPEFLRDTNTLLMRAVYVADMKFGSVFAQALVEAQTGPVADALPHRPQISIVSLTPAAFSNYLRRTTPVPRARLACLLYALSLALPRTAGDGRTPAVLGIDIDITPPESAAGAVSPVWEPVDDDEKPCHDAIVRASRIERPTVVQALAWAVGALERHHCVVAIGFPHPADTDPAIRDAFIARVRPRRLGPRECAGVQFASPDLALVPHEDVSEYPAQRLAFEALPPSARVALGGRFAALPAEHCSLGRAMGHRLRFLRDPADAAALPCLAPAPDEVLQAVEPVAYEARPLRLGPARSAIAYSSVVPAKPSFEGDLLADATRAFRATLQPSDLFVLTADSGTGSDQFMVPVVEAPVPGAWVHAAIALSEFDRAAAHGRPARLAAAWHAVPTAAQRALQFAGHVAADLVLAALFVLVDETAVRRARSMRNEVGRQIAVAVTPAAVLLAGVALTVWLDARSVAAGEWHPHLLVPVGLALHKYLELASHADAPRDGTGQRRTDPVRVCAQLVWAVALWVFVLLGADPDLRDAAWAAAAAALVCGALHCCAARRWPSVPLPWRVHAARSHTG